MVSLRLVLSSPINIDNVIVFHRVKFEQKNLDNNLLPWEKAKTLRHSFAGNYFGQMKIDYSSIPSYFCTCINTSLPGKDY